MAVIVILGVLVLVGFVWSAAIPLWMQIGWTVVAAVSMGLMLAE